jgi:tetratricopeptide (TPR) repeat protein
MHDRCCCFADAGAASTSTGESHPEFAIAFVAEGSRDLMLTRYAFESGPDGTVKVVAMTSRHPVETARCSTAGLGVVSERMLRSRLSRQRVVVVGPPTMSLVSEALLEFRRSTLILALEPGAISFTTLDYPLPGNLSPHPGVYPPLMGSVFKSDSTGLEVRFDGTAGRRTILPADQIRLVNRGSANSFDPSAGGRRIAFFETEGDIGFYLHAVDTDSNIVARRITPSADMEAFAERPFVAEMAAFSPNDVLGLTPAEAVKVLKQTPSIHSGSRFAAFILGSLAGGTEQDEQKIDARTLARFCDTYQSLGLGDRDESVARAASLRLLGDMESAIQVLRATCLKEPNDSVSLASLALCLLGRKPTSEELEEAAAAAEKALSCSVDPDELVLSANAAVCGARGDFESGEDFLHLAIIHCRRHTSLPNLISQLRRLERRAMFAASDEARSSKADAGLVNADPRVTQTFHSLTGDAVSLLTWARSPVATLRSSDEFLDAARNAMQRRRPEDAIKILSAGLVKNAFNEVLVCELAEVLSKQGKHDEAIQCWEFLLRVTMKEELDRDVRKCLLQLPAWRSSNSVNRTRAIQRVIEYWNSGSAS